MFQGLVEDVLVVVDVFEIKWRVVHKEDNGATQWCSPMVSGRVIFTFCQNSDFLLQFYAYSKFLLILKSPKSKETSIGDFFQHHHV